MATTRAVQVPAQGGDFELVERELPEPGRGQVRVRVDACGICHSDSWAKEGGYPGQSWPLVPGHEVAGVVDAVGEDVHPWQVGQRVGVGWFGGSCGWCEACRSGDLISCAHLPIPGITADGGYATHLVVGAGALAAIPDGMASEDAAPLMCAGITTFNALRRSVGRPGDRVAILGVGGLGHLGVQYAAKMGFEVVAIARGRDKEELARHLGAHEYVDSTAGNPGEALAKMGGARVILSTVTSAGAVDAVLGGLGRRGQVLLVGASGDPVHAVPAMMIGQGLSIVGHASGTSQDSEDTLRFSQLTGVRPMIETRPLEQAADAYARMMSGDARFRMVLTVGQ